VRKRGTSCLPLQGFSIHSFRATSLIIEIPTPGEGLVRTVYKSVTESIDDMFFGPSMLDVLIQRLTTQAAEFAGIVGSSVHDEDLVAQALRASGNKATEDALANLSGDLKPLEGETSTSDFTAPICDLVLGNLRAEQEEQLVQETGDRDHTTASPWRDNREVMDHR
jgi:hypothetical protein